MTGERFDVQTGRYLGATSYQEKMARRALNNPEKSNKFIIY
ncbi:MAG: hypothetical protein PHU12_00435 [Candidatus Aenigmarchaeota archaeon]|nr:hypothetical protein [Candidatus Aenigmarchaeota archaeon]